VGEGGEIPLFFKLIPILALLSNYGQGSCLSNVGTEGQRGLVQHEVGVANAKNGQATQDLCGFVASLSTVWRDGEVRPTHRKRSNGPRTYRTRVDPFEAVWSQVEQWLNERSDANAKDLLLRLQESMPGAFPPGQLRTLQRRVKQWRSEIARQLVLGVQSRSALAREVCAGAAANFEVRS
jgi:hypothetical protein